MGLTFEDGQIEDALNVILAVFEPHELIFTCAEGEDYDQSRRQWLDVIVRMCNTEASKSGKRHDLRLKQEAFDKQKDKVSRARRKLRDLREAFAHDDDIRDAQQDFDQFSEALVELEAELSRAGDTASKHISDSVKVLIKSIDHVLREE